MSSSVKLLKGFRNPINDETNTLGLLVKSDLDLKEHLRNSKEKLLTALTCIIENYDSNHTIYFYNKLQVLYENKTEYLSTKAYLTNSCNLKRDLNSSVEEVLKMTYGKKTSHFVNVRIKFNDDIIELSQKEFKDLNLKLISALSKMNEEDYLFIDDDNVKPIDKKPKNAIKKSNKVKPINDNSLFVDEENVKPIKKKPKNTVNIKPIKKSNNVKPINDDSLFIDDDDDVKPIKKSNNVKPINDDLLFID